MSASESPYTSPCPFCAIADTYPPDQTSPVPTSPDPELLSPQCHLILSSPHILAFLDILPISPAHVLLVTRTHLEKLTDLQPHPSTSTSQATHLAETASELGKYIPLLSTALCRATGVEDWNIVQNNGVRAAQVVPHVHFHLIPRYQEGRAEAGGGKGDLGTLKSWRMFGKGTREELDDDEAVGIAKKLRAAVQEVLDEAEGREGKAKM